MKIAKITIDKLANIVVKGFDKVSKDIKEVKNTVEDLAGITAKNFNSVEGRFSLIDIRFNSVDERFNQVDERLNTLEQGQANIILRLDNTAHRFELKELQTRITKVEKKNWDR